MPKAFDTMVDRPDLAEIASPLRQFFAAQNDVLAAYLFGSLARGKARSYSDVDIAVILADRGDRDPLARTFRLGEVAELLNGILQRKIDIVDFEDCSPFLAFEILKDGIRIFDRDILYRQKAELRQYQIYHDELPHREKQYERTREFFLRGV